MIKDLPLSRKFKSYVGLKGAEQKLQQWLNDIHFITISAAVEQINWDDVPVIKLE
ncbi:MAG: hypothetical protein KGZ87_03660 [Bacteroidetes bacterium]|nr:hypothetical protein [Bacteroidota bacterium]